MPNELAGRVILHDDPSSDNISRAIYLSDLHRLPVEIVDNEHRVLGYIVSKTWMQKQGVGKSG